ncbi:MAG: ATP-dependent Clp protease adapter ClpS [Spirochaetaceae bacterium]|jgi:ATP-dependent Clp protease adaptor protein ClpS|nr:ATP-dependent Clp protease adapter ClpS [Spirochaetaceae bacterium]
MPVQDRNSTKVASRQEEKLREPGEFRVILLNDHYTTMDFVVDILMHIFHKNEEDAYRIMMDVHRKGRGIVGIYPWDIATTKAEQVHSLARQYEYPLRCVVEQI